MKMALASGGIVGERSRHLRARRRSTLLLGLFLAYTLLPLFYLVVASTKSNQDLFSTFGLWFGSEFALAANLHDLFAYSDGVFARWL